jgi:hypothetical protein
METAKVLALMKFGWQEHIADFVRGTLYMNTLQYFAALEKAEASDLRADPFEGVGRLLQFDGATLSVKVDADFQPVGRIAGPVQWRPTGGIRANVFCMYALRPPQGPKLIDELNFRFGDTFALLTDGDEFLRRVRRAGDQRGQELTYGLVGYVDERIYQGSMGIFRKRALFSYQSEFRIAVTPGTDGPYKLQLGDLSDIMITGRLAELNQLIRLEHAVGGESGDVAERQS